MSTPCSPTVEASDLKSGKCSFESSHGENENWIDEKWQARRDAEQKMSRREFMELLVAQEVASNPEWTIRGIARSLQSTPSAIKNRLRAIGYTFTCVKCPAPIWRFLVSDSSTCNDCRKLLGEEYDSRVSEKAERIRLRPLAKAARNPISLDWKRKEDSTFFMYELLPSNDLTPAEMLMWKEDYEEKRKYERAFTGQRVDVSVADWEERRIGKLMAAAPAGKGKRGKFRGGPITKYSPERGITQRHIKMGPTQFT